MAILRRSNYRILTDALSESARRLAAQDRKEHPDESPPGQGHGACANLVDALTKSVRQIAAFDRIAYADGSSPSYKFFDNSDQKLGAGVSEVGTSGNKRAAVVAWDLSHNPAGRAHALVNVIKSDWDVDLIGAVWSRYGNSLWAPLAGLESGPNPPARLVSFGCRNFLDFFPKAVVYSEREIYDVVYVSKPRLPALLLGALIARHSECPLVLDIDDLETSFFPASEGPPPAFLSPEDWHEPYEEAATRYCETLIDRADAITVSNVALRDRFGGVLVRHARDPADFDVSKFDRRAIRAELGLSAGDFALLFVGTPRAHKGVLEVAQALQEISDPRIKLHVVGVPDEGEIRKKLLAYRKHGVRIHPACSFDDLPRYLAAADCVPLVQDPLHPIAEYQIPAKISDALSMGVPVLTTDVPPLRDLHDLPGMYFTRREDLSEAIKSLAEITTKLDRQEIREGFLSELAIDVSSERFRDAAASAAAVLAKRGGTGFADFISAAEKIFCESARPNPPAATAPEADSGKPDLVFLWKQHDTGLYGRRSDMIAKHLLKLGVVKRILFFDATAYSEHLDYWMEPDPDGNTREQESLLLRNTIVRHLKGFDEGGLLQRVLLSNGHYTHPNAKPDSEGFVKFVSREMNAAGFDPDRTLLWVCPVVWDAPSLVDAIDFRGVIVDLIDDEREFEAGGAVWRERLAGIYEKTLELADVVFSNCEPLAQAFEGVRGSIHVVPNGAERFDIQRDTSRDKVKRPTIGYVGTLRDRIDWHLLHELVAAHPNWSFVFAGASSGSRDEKRLAEFENVTLMGVVEYSRLREVLGSFDVGIVPHVQNDMTKHMNPLKAYNYISAGLPVVATPIDNLGGLEHVIRLASSAKEFSTAINECLRSGPLSPAETDRILERVSWEERVSRISRILNEEGLLTP